MNTDNLDEKKIAPEYTICKKCKNDDTELCLGCTSFCGYSPVLICGIPCGTGQAQFYHKNFEPKE